MQSHLGLGFGQMIYALCHATP